MHGKYDFYSINTMYTYYTFATANRLVVFAGQQWRFVDDVLRFVVGVRHETVAAHLLADRQRVLCDVPVTASITGTVVMVVVVVANGGSVVVVRRQVHEYVLHVDGHAERLFKYRCADCLVLFAAA